MTRITFGLLAVSFALFLGSFANGEEPRRELLWPNGAPGARGDTADDKPTLTAYLPDAEKAVGAAVVIFPGGGYGHLALDHEGKQIAERFVSIGVAAFVLEYRHNGRGYKHPAPLQDAQRAVRTVRSRAKELHVKEDRIGVLGFSAGGHLASTVATHFDQGNASSDDPIERIGCRPDFAILCYPVITMGESSTHKGSQDSLLGKNPSPETLRNLSNEKQVTAQTPPTFLFHTDADSTVSPENSVAFYLALRHAQVPAELHIYRAGRHGLGLAQNVPGTSLWWKDCEAWMRGLKLLDTVETK